jgi:hypothetical protein
VTPVPYTPINRTVNSRHEHVVFRELRANGREDLRQLMDEIRRFVLRIQQIGGSMQQQKYQD